MIYIIPTDTCYGIACALEDKKNYEKIYKIKKRRFEKPLALMVESFDWLAENTDLTSEQIDFLKAYENPFTILTDSTPVRLFIEFWDKEEEHFLNKDVYDYISFRVANNDVEESLTKSLGPIWLTSANISWIWETYDIEQIEKDFEYYIEKWVVEVMGTHDLNEDIPASDVFRFVWETLELEYMRKN